MPAWGRWARLSARVGIRLFWVTLVVSIMTLVLLTIERSVHVIADESTLDGVMKVPTAIAQGALLLMVVAGVVWLAAELVTGYRQGRATSGEPRVRSRR